MLLSVFLQIDQFCSFVTLKNFVDNKFDPTPEPKVKQMPVRFNFRSRVRVKTAVYKEPRTENTAAKERSRRWRINLAKVP